MSDTKEEEECKLDISWYPSSVEDLHELLTFYRQQTITFKNERKEYESVIESLKMSNSEKHRLEWALHNKSESNASLTKQLSDTHILLYKEKNANISFQSQLKAVEAQMNEVRNDKTHLLQLLQSSNQSLCAQCTQKNTKHKRCQACTHNRTHSFAANPHKLTTVYLPNQSDQTIVNKLEAKESELRDLKAQFMKINEYLMSDRNRAYERLEEMRAENESKFAALQSETERVSTQHLFAIKEYLHFRRHTTQRISDLEFKSIQIKHENARIKGKYDSKLANIVSVSHNLEKKLKKESSKIINGFRMETISKHKELNNVRDELQSLTKSYNFDMKSLKHKLRQTHQKNAKLSRIHKCHRMGVESDVSNLKKRLNKLQNGLNTLNLNACNHSYHHSLQNEIQKISDKLLQIAKLTEE